jgi:hypothetical protein
MSTLSVREQLILMLQEDYDTPQACERADEMIAEFKASNANEITFDGYGYRFTLKRTDVS